MISPLLTRLVQSIWLDISVVLFCIFFDLDFVSVLKNSKRREFGQYPAVLTSRLVNNALCKEFLKLIFPALALHHELISSDEGQTIKTSALKTLSGGLITFLTYLIKANYLVTTVSVERNCSLYLFFISHLIEIFFF